MSTKLMSILAASLVGFHAFGAPTVSPSKAPALGAASLPKRATAASRASAPACPVEVVPGASFGPVKIGMSREDLERLGMRARLPAAQEQYVSRDESEFARGHVGPFFVELEGNRVSRIRAALKDLPKCVRLADGVAHVELRPAAAFKIAPRAGFALLTGRDGVDVEVERNRQVEPVNF